MERTVWSISHSDADGLCSCAVVKSIYPNAIPMITNYGKYRNLFRIKPGDLVFVTDFTLNYDEFMRLRERNVQIVWIDHHKANYDEIYAKDASWVQCDGIRRDDYCGAVLTWMYLHNGMPPETMPTIVKLVNDYDLWKFEDPRTKDLSYGLGLWEIRPGNPSGDAFRRDLLSDNPAKLKQVLEAGAHINRYVQFRDDTYCKDLAYYTSISTPEGKKNVLAMGVRTGNSSVFDRMDRSNCDAVFTGQYVANIGRWRCSFYSPDNEKIILPIAQMYGGSGHPKAAGLQPDSYPLPLPSVRKPTPIKEALEPYNKLIRMREASVVIKQWLDRGTSITTKASMFPYRDFCGYPVLAINHQFLPDVLRIVTTSSNCIIPDSGEIVKLYLGWTLTNSGWFRCCVYRTDETTKLSEVRDAIVRSYPDAAEHMTEYDDGLWWYQRDMPVRPPIKPIQLPQQARM